MELRRFFVTPEDVRGEMVTVTGDEFVHMTRVLRMKPGYKAIVCADDGKERLCTLREIGSGYAVLSQDEVREADRKKVSLTLFAGLLKNSRFDFVVQKAVELGVDRIVPFVSAYTAEKKFNADRANKIALEAAKQCGSVWLSRVEEPITFDEATGMFGKFDTVLFAYEGDRTHSLRNTEICGTKLALIVGSEGGFRADEAERAVACGAKSVTLGRRILRAETAGIVGVALVLDAAGELDYD